METAGKKQDGPVFRLQSSVRGEIEWLLMVFGGEFSAAYADVLVKLSAALPTRAQVLAICQNERFLLDLWGKVRKVPAASQVSFEIVEPGAALDGGAKCYLAAADDRDSIGDSWSRDHLLRTWDAKGRAARLFTTREANKHLASVLSKFWVPGVGLEASGSVQHLRFEGGNLLADAGCVLIGYEQFKQAWPQPPICSEADAIEAVSAWAGGGHDIIPVGKGYLWPPGELGDRLKDIFIHLDTYISLTGEWSGRMPGRRVALVATCDKMLGKDGESTRHNTELAELNRYLDAVAAQLSERFEVWRNPVPVLLDYTRDGMEHGFYLGLLNNVLVEIGPGGKTVWFGGLQHAPDHEANRTYLRRLELQYAAIWQSIGFKAILVDADFHPFFRGGGGLHCLTNDFIR